MIVKPKMIVLRSNGSNLFNLFIEHVVRSLQNSNKVKVCDLIDKRESGAVIEFKNDDPMFQWEYTKEPKSDYVEIALGIDVSIPHRSGDWLFSEPFECHCYIPKEDVIMEALDWNNEPTDGITTYEKMYHGGK